MQQADARRLVTMTLFLAAAQGWNLRGRDEPRCDGWPVLDFRKPTMTTLIVGTPSGAIGHEGDDP